MKLVSLAFALLLAALATGCSTTVSYSGIEVRPSPQHPAPGTQKLCTFPESSGSARSGGGRSTTVTNNVVTCTWVNAYGQQCSSIENRQYRAQFDYRDDDRDDKNRKRPSGNGTNYRWKCTNN